MTKIDRKLIYNLLCSNDVLQYLNFEDKAEFYYCCKYIYEKCTKFRLELCYYGESQFQVYIDKYHKGLNWVSDDYELNLEYFDAIINKYKEHFSLNFTNLNSLIFAHLTIPKTTLQRIIKNLPNLRSLVFSSIEAVYSKNDPQITDFKFSQYLRELTWDSCSQSELDNTDYSSIKQYVSDSEFANESILDISLNLVSTLRYIECYFEDDDDSKLLNQTISNNPGLVRIKTTLNCFNLDSFKLISSSSNLTKLNISLYGDSMKLDSSILSKLPNIKILEFYFTSKDQLDSIGLIIQNCPNLEELMLNYFYISDDYITGYINGLVNLKVLKIRSNGFELSFLDKVLPQSNLEKLEIISSRLIKFNFGNFINMKKLELISNILKPSIFEDEYKVPEYEELTDWRMINYAKSIQYWKIK